MGPRFYAGLMLSVLLVPSAYAASFPKHADVCVGGIVSKERLAKAILKQNPDWQRLYIDANDGLTSDPQFKPQWRRIFTDPKFCIDDPGCLGPPLSGGGPNAKPDNAAAIYTLQQLRFEFSDAVQTNADGRHYAIANKEIGTDYLLGGDSKNAMACVGPEVPSAPKATVLKLPIRLRASADDLGIDAARDKDAFRSVKPATASFSRDGIKKANSTKLQAAIGYAIPLSIDLAANSNVFTYSNGELVPYLAAGQSFTKVDGKSVTFAETNNVAVGALLNTQTVFTAFNGVNNVVMAKPQYLWNTTDKSEIASVKFIYQPWSAITNTPIQIGTFLEATWFTFLFDLRNNTGIYTNKGNDPVKAATYRSFERAGTKFGFAVATNAAGPHMVLTVTETYLYGLSGTVRHLSLFDTSLSFYFDSTSNLALTVSYTNGRNEDTAEKAQTFTVGISARF